MNPSVSVNEPVIPSDQELVEQAQAGDHRAFDELVLRHQRRAMNVAYQLLRNWEDATEVAQDAFVRVHRGLPAFRGDCAFTTWLHQIVVNLAHNRHRWWQRRGRQQTYSLDQPVLGADGEMTGQQATDTETPDQVTIAREMVEEVAAALGRLPRRYREVLVLRNIEGLSYEEIATVLRCSLGTVKTRIARGREMLCREIKGTK